MDTTQGSPMVNDTSLLIGYPTTGVAGIIILLRLVRSLSGYYSGFP